MDYKASVWINSRLVGSHTGGYAAFSFEILDYVHRKGENRIVVQVEDSHSRAQPRGKQRWIKDIGQNLI